MKDAWLRAPSEAYAETQGMLEIGRLPVIQVLNSGSIRLGHYKTQSKRQLYVSEGRLDRV